MPSSPILPRSDSDPDATRSSLLRRLRNWDDHGGWQEFSDTYWKLIYSVAIKGGMAFDYFWRVIKPKTPQGAEMIYWERDEGGRVFNAGAIAACWALRADPKFQTLMRNVLAHFGVPRPGA